jgi:hypothetical protein
VAGIQRLAIYDATTASELGDGAGIWVSTANYLVSVIATNTTAVDGEISVVLKTVDEDEEDGALIAYKLPLPAYNSYETFRFGVNNTDAVHIAGSAGIRYFVQGIEQA